MNKITGIILALVVVVVVGGVAYAAVKNNKGDAMEKEMSDESSLMEKKEMMNEDSMMKSEGDAIMDAEIEDAQPGVYEAYAPEKLARAETGDVVLFFHASWCPSCRGLSADIEKHLSAIPARVSILKVDYDSETELKKKYGITYQHTLVQVAADGTMIDKWSGSPTLSDLASHIN